MLTYGGKVLKTSGGHWVVKAQQPVDPYNPLGLPQYTIRARFPNEPAATSNGGFSGTITHVSNDIYDIQTSNWDKLFGATGFLSYSQIDTKPLEVLGANSTGVTSMYFTFYMCSFSSIPLMDTSSVTDMTCMLSRNTSLSSIPNFVTDNVTKFSEMFDGCTGLTSVPAAFNMSSATNVQNMFRGCTNVSNGALSLYNSVSQQASPPSNHKEMFRNCGANTVNGLEELKQIPGDWGGLYGQVTCEKYYYSDASTDLAAYSIRSTGGYISGAIWVPVNNVTYANGVLYSIKTPSTAGTMRITPTSQFYRWNSTTTQSSSSAVKFGLFTTPKETLSRQQVYGDYYGWKSINEPQFLYELDSAGTAPSLGYKTYTPPENAVYNITSSYPSVPGNAAFLLCLYIKSGGNYYFGTVILNTGYLPYTSNSDLIVQVSNTTPWVS